MLFATPSFAGMRLVFPTILTPSVLCDSLMSTVRMLTDEYWSKLTTIFSQINIYNKPNLRKNGVNSFIIQISFYHYKRQKLCIMAGEFCGITLQRNQFLQLIIRKLSQPLFTAGHGQIS